MAGLSLCGEFHPPLPVEPEMVRIAASELAELRKDQLRVEFVLWRHFRDADWEATKFGSRADIDTWIAAEPGFTGEVTA